MAYVCTNWALGKLGDPQLKDRHAFYCVLLALAQDADRGATREAYSGAVRLGMRAGVHKRTAQNALDWFVEREWLRIVPGAPGRRSVTYLFWQAGLRSGVESGLTPPIESGVTPPMSGLTPRSSGLTPPSERSDATQLPSSDSQERDSQESSLAREASRSDSMKQASANAAPSFGEGWEPSEDAFRWVIERVGSANATEVVENFIDWHLAHGKKLSNPERALRLWVRRERAAPEAEARARAPGGVRPPLRLVSDRTREPWESALLVVSADVVAELRDFRYSHEQWGTREGHRLIAEDARILRTWDVRQGAVEKGELPSVERRAALGLWWDVRLDAWIAGVEELERTERAGRAG